MNVDMIMNNAQKMKRCWDRSSGRKIQCLLLLVFLQLLTIAVLAQNEGSPSYYFRQPTGHGNTIVFQHSDKIWRYDLLTQSVSLLVDDKAEIGSPVISPDGQAIGYVAGVGGDREIFLTSLKSGATRRLTYEGGYDVKVQGWLNGKELLYSTTIKSKKRGSLLFAINSETFASRPIPLMEASEGCLLGSEFIFVKNEELADSNKQYQGGYAQRIYKIDAALLSKEARSISSDNKKRASTLLTKKYQGISRSPVCLADRIYFLSDQSGQFNIWSMNPNGGNLIQHTFEKEFDIKSISMLSTSKILYQQLGDVFVFDVKDDKKEKLAIKLPEGASQETYQWVFNINNVAEFDISRDGATIIATAHGKLMAVDVLKRTVRCLVCEPAVRIKSPAILSDGRNVIALADSNSEYDLYSFDLHSSAKGKLISTSIHEGIYDFSVSPDDTSLLIRSVAGNLYYMDMNSGKAQAVQLETRTRPEDISWSRDSRYAVFITYNAQDIGRVTVFDKVCLRTRYLTNGRYDASSPVFSSNNAEIFYITQANFWSSTNDTWAPSNYWPTYDNRSLIYSLQFQKRPELSDKPDCENPYMNPPTLRDLSLNVQELPVVAGNYDRLFLIGNRLHAFAKRGVRDDLGNIVSFSTKQNEYRSTQVDELNDVLDYRQSKGGDVLLVKGIDGMSVTRSDAEGKLGAPFSVKPNSNPVLAINVAQEHNQMFREFWRLYRDYFWDINMNNLDWQETYEKYVKYLPRVSNRAEFNELVSHMVGELGAGHTSIGNLASRAQNSHSGALGASFTDDKGLYVTEIYDGDTEIMEQRSPLSVAEPRVDVGDRIRRINEFPVVNQYMLDRLLYDKVGQTVIATIEKPNGSIVTTRISPISAEREAWLRNRYWAFSNQQYVDRVSKSKVGYIHLSASYEADFAELVRQYSYQHNRSGLILDLRGNNGGNVDPWVLNFLQRRTWLYVQDRYDKMPLKHPRDSYEGKLVVLIDGDTYSDGELIAEGVRRLHLGTLVGSRTSGAGVWVNDDKTLIDGTRVRIPVSGSYLTGKQKREWIIEGSGVKPDILVENDPYHSYFNHDAQLNSAIKVAMNE